MNTPMNVEAVSAILGNLLAVLYERGVIEDGDVGLIVDGPNGKAGPLAGNAQALGELIGRRLRK